MWKSYLRPQIFNWKMLNLWGYKKQNRKRPVLKKKKDKDKRKQKETRNRQMIEKVLIFLDHRLSKCKFLRPNYDPSVKRNIWIKRRGMKGCLCTREINERLFCIWNITEAKYSKIESLINLTECWIEKTTVRRSLKIKLKQVFQIISQIHTKYSKLICGPKGG